MNTISAYFNPFSDQFRQTMEDTLLAGFTGKGFYIKRNEIYQGEIRNGETDGRGILIKKLVRVTVIYDAEFFEEL